MFLNFLASIDRLCSFAVSLAFTVAKRSRRLTKFLPDGHLTLFTVSKATSFALYRVHRTEMFPGTGDTGPEFQIYSSLRSLRQTFFSRRSRLFQPQSMEVHELKCSDDCLLWLKWSPHSPFVAAGYHPIRAGNDSKQRKEYVVCVVEAEEVFLSTISEGATVVYYVDVNRHWHSSSEFYVLALRYDPDYLASFFPSVPAGVADEDCTGPFFWKGMDLPQPSKHHSPRKSKKGKQCAHP